MDKIKTVKIKNPDGSVSEETYTISVDAKNVDMDNGKELQETIGTINVDTDGNIAKQLNILKNNEIKLNKKPYYFNTVVDMKAASYLKINDMVITLGYYKVNDAGGAIYKITDVESQTEEQEELNNGLYAIAIVKKNNRKKLKETTSSTQTGSRDLYKSFGFKYVRISVVWSVCEKTQGIIDVTGFMSNINLFLERGITPILLLCYNNTLYASSEREGLLTAANREAFARFCSVVADNCKNHNIIYTIWNEPNYRGFWNNDNADNLYYNYVESVRLASQAIKAADPTAKIGAPDLAGMGLDNNAKYGTLLFLEGCCKYGLLDYIDYVSVHTYMGKYPEKIYDSDSYFNFYNLRSLINSYTNKQIGIIIPECGENTTVITEEEQAYGLVRYYLLNFANGIDITSSYSFKDTGTDITNPESNFGMVRYDGQTLKPSGVAVKFMNTLVGDYIFSKFKKMHLDTDYCLVLYNEIEKKTAYILWTTDDEHIIKIDDDLVNIPTYNIYGEQVSVTTNNFSIKKNPTYFIQNAIENYEAMSKEEVELRLNALNHDLNAKIANDISKYQLSRNNILSNSDFYDGKTNIRDWNGSSEIIADSELNDKVLKITSTGQGAYINNSFDCNVGDILTWSVWVKGDPGNLVVGLECANTSGEPTDITTGIVRKDLYNVTKWHYISKTIKVTRTGHNNFIFYTQEATSENPREFFIYHPQIVKGYNSAHDFQPSLNDFQRKSNLIENGTFTPTLCLATNTSIEAAGYSTQTGIYRRIGNLVFFYIKLEISDPTFSTSGFCVIGGLPHASTIECPCSSRINKINFGANKIMNFYVDRSYKSITPKIVKADGTGDDTLRTNQVLQGALFELSGFYLIN